MNVQLDQHQAELFYRMQKAVGLSVTETLKRLIYPALQKFEEQTALSEQKAGRDILGIKTPEMKIDLVMDTSCMDKVLSGAIAHRGKDFKVVDSSK